MRKIKRRWAAVYLPQRLSPAPPSDAFSSRDQFDSCTNTVKINIIRLHQQWDVVKPTSNVSFNILPQNGIWHRSGHWCQRLWLKVLCPTQHKIGHFVDFFPANISASTEETKPNTTKANTYPEHKNTTTQKNKARFGRLIWPQAWKQSRTYSTAPRAQRGLMSENQIRRVWLGPESGEFLVSWYRDKVRNDIAISSPSLPVRLNHQLSHQLHY